MSLLRGLLTLATVLGVLLSSSAGSAHQIKSGVLALQEVSPGRFAQHWSAPQMSGPTATPGRPTYPEHCALVSDDLLDCGAAGLVGAIRFPHDDATTSVSVEVRWLNGQRTLRLASGSPPLLELVGMSEGAGWKARWELGSGYALLGVEHILLGIDHLMFVAGLLLFVRSWRRLLLTITAFTVAHSLTLAAASLDLVTLPSAPLELCIALSILLLAVEAVQKHKTWTQRAPWLVAFSFGLLHGFAFASALAELGLPPHHVPLALFSFNVGVELGQLLCVVVLALGYRLLARRETWKRRFDQGAIVALGAAAVYWSLDRAVVMWQSWQG